MVLTQSFSKRAAMAARLSRRHSFSSRMARPTITKFAELHQRLWSWGGVPLLYRKTLGLVQLFRCAHKPDFVSATVKLSASQSKR